MNGSTHLCLDHQEIRSLMLRWGHRGGPPRVRFGHRLIVVSLESCAWPTLLFTGCSTDMPACIVAEATAIGWQLHATAWPGFASRLACDCSVA